MATRKEAEGDLGQLPGHHPLIKDGMSDEGLCFCSGHNEALSVKVKRDKCL